MSPSRNPRLVGRFAVSSLVAFVAIGGVLVVLVSRQIQHRQEATAQFNAEFITESTLRYELTDEDLRSPATPESSRYQELLSFVRTRFLKFPIVRVKIWRQDGTILFSDDPRLLGKKLELEEDLEEAFEGEAVSEVSDLTKPENIYERILAPKLFETYVPLYRNPSDAATPSAVVEVYTDYSEIQAQIDHLFQTIFLTLLSGLSLLYVLLLPITFRVARRLSQQNTTLQDQARQLTGLLEREQATVAELKELNELKDEFVAMASHEVRTPLTSIIGYAKTLRRPEFSEDPAARQEFLEAIERQGDRLSVLVENLLAASRIEEEGNRLALGPISLDELIGDVLDGLGPRGRRVTVSLSNDLPTIVSDRQRLQLVLANLLDNALKFSAAGTSCELTASRDGDFVAMTVRDHGVGIAPQHLDRIFDRFYQVDSSATRGYGGVGLGLSLVKELVQTLGGTIQVASTPGEGSAFSVKVPLAPPAEAAAWTDPWRHEEAASL